MIVYLVYVSVVYFQYFFSICNNLHDTARLIFIVHLKECYKSDYCNRCNIYFLCCFTKESLSKSKINEYSLQCLPIHDNKQCTITTLKENKLDGTVVESKSSCHPRYCT